MNKESQIFYRIIRDFITCYLPKQKAASPNTIKSYRDTINIFLDYQKDVKKIPLFQISFESVSQLSIEEFLEWLENEKKYTVSSRNQRLSALKSLYKYAAGKDNTLIVYYQDIQKIPKKKQPKGHEIEFFNESALESILHTPNVNKKKGYRDMIFMTVLYDTAARVQELLDVCIRDIHIESDSPYIILHGKGRKTRLVPLMDKTASHLSVYLSRFHINSKEEEHLFYIERKGKLTAMSPDNVEKFIKKYGIESRANNQDVPEHLYPHMFRHSRSMHLYRNGMPLPLLSELLGHSQMETTISYYANADVTMKKEAISKATKDMDSIFNNKAAIGWEDDEEMLKKLYGLL